MLVAHKVPVNWEYADNEESERCGESGVSAGQNHLVDSNTMVLTWGFGQSDVRRERRAVATPRCGGSIGGLLGGESGLTPGEMRVPEMAYGTAGLVGQAVLRTGFRGRLGAGVRVRLGYTENRFSSRPYASVPSSKIKGRGILRAVLRPAFQTVLRSIFHAVLRKRGFEGSRRRANGLRTRLRVRGDVPGQQPPESWRRLNGAPRACPR